MFIDFTPILGTILCISTLEYLLVRFNPYPQSFAFRDNELNSNNSRVSTATLQRVPVALVVTGKLLIIPLPIPTCVLCTRRGDLDPDCRTVQLMDCFDHVGPHGRHVCMVFEMLGCNLLSVIKRYNYHGIPIRVVKSMARQMCQGLDFLHRICK